MPIRSHQARDQNREIENSHQRLDDCNRARLARDGSDSRSAKRSHRRVAVIDEVEAIGNGVCVDDRIEVESVRIQKREHSVDAGEAKADEQVDAKRSEDGFRSGLMRTEDATEDDDDDKGVEGEAEDEVKNGERAGIDAEIQDSLGKGGNGEGDGNDDQATAETGGVDREEDSRSAQDAKSVIAEVVVVGVWIDDERGQ